MALVITKQHFRSSPEWHGNAVAITFKPCSAAGAVRQSPRQAGMHKWPMVIRNLRITTHITCRDQQFDIGCIPHVLQKNFYTQHKKNNKSSEYILS